MDRTTRHARRVARRAGGSLGEDETLGTRCGPTKRLHDVPGPPSAHDMLPGGYVVLPEVLRGCGAVITAARE